MYIRQRCTALIILQVNYIFHCHERFEYQRKRDIKEQYSHLDLQLVKDLNRDGDLNIVSHKEEENFINKKSATQATECLEHRLPCRRRCTGPYSRVNNTSFNRKNYIIKT